MEKYITNIKDLVIQTMTNGSEIKAKAESGDALSCFQMGMIHLLGINTPIDFKVASSFLSNQSLSDDPDANRLLGFIAECEGNYSLAFKNYANAGKANRPYINKVSEERMHLQGDFKRLELPSTVQNKIITNVLNEYIKGGDTKVEASIKIAIICEDEKSCLGAAQALYDNGDYFSTMRWLQNGNIFDNNNLYTSVKKKITDLKSAQNLPNELDLIEIEGDSFLNNTNLISSYSGIKRLVDEATIACKNDWYNIVPPIITALKRQHPIATIFDVSVKNVNPFAVNSGFSTPQNSVNNYGRDSSFIFHCNFQVDNMKGKTGCAILTMTTMGRSFQKKEMFTPNYDSCLWNDFRFPIYINDISSVVAKGQYLFQATIELFDEQYRCMATHSLSVTIRYSGGLFKGQTVEVI